MTEEVTIQCDASEKGLGAVLLQKGQPVAFASRTLTKTEQRYAKIEKECLAIVFACTKFSQYITRREKITIESDHKPLQAIFKKSLLAAPSRLQRMILQLQRYSIDVTYKPGKQMYIADHLSRAQLTEQEITDEFQVFALELEQMNPLRDVKLSNDKLAMLQKATEQDHILQTLKTTILVGWPEQRDEVPISIREYWNFMRTAYHTQWCAVEESTHHNSKSSATRSHYTSSLKPSRHRVMLKESKRQSLLAAHEQ